MILEVERLKSLFGGKVSSNGKNLQIKCPKCGKDECYISLNENNHPGRCWRGRVCGYTFNIYSLLRSLDLLEEFVSEFKSYKEEIVFEFNKLDIQTQIEELEEIKLPSGFRLLTKSEYLDSRGFVRQDYTNLLPGTTRLSMKYKDSIIFPVFENFKIVGYISRSIHSKEYCQENGILRYQKSDSSFDSVIYGLIYGQDIETVVVVEGIFDYRKVKSVIEKYSLNMFCFPLLGVSLSNTQAIKLLSQNCKNLIFLLDLDIESKLRNFSRDFYYRFNCFVTFCKGKDPDESTEEEIMNALENLLPLEDFLLNTIKISLINE